MIDYANAKTIFTPKGELAKIVRGAELLWQKIVAPNYTELEYIESAGTQWIDIGTTVNTATDTIKLVFQNAEPNTYKWLFGEHDNNARFGLGSGDGGNKRNVAYGNATYKVRDEQQYDSKHAFVANENGVYLDGVKIANFASFASASTLYLFNLNLTGGNYVCCAKVWSYKHTRNGILIRDLIPVFDYNGVPCMYDRVTEQFFYNKGTGTFLYGEIQTAPYKTELAYLESTGAQYIDTGYVMTADDMSFEGEMLWTESKGNANFFFGYRSVQTAALTGDMRAFFIYGATPIGRLAIRYGKNGDNSAAAIKQNTKHKVSFNGVNLKVDNVTFATVSGAYNPAQYKSLWLFNCNTTGYYSSDITPFAGRIYSFKMLQGTTLVRDFIPVLDWNNVPCMYDKVSGELFYNQGSGEFLYSV